MRLQHLVSLPFNGQKPDPNRSNEHPVSPAQGKSSGMEVLVQGKQTQAIVDLLLSKGVPKRWIVSLDLSVKKK